MVRSFLPVAIRRIVSILPLAIMATTSIGVTLVGVPGHPTECRADDPAAAATVADAEEKAADAKPADEKSADEKSADEKAADENAAIEIPDGTAEELFAFATETMRNRGNDIAAVKRAARAVVDTAAKIRTLDDVTLPTETRAIGLQLPALQFLARMDKDAADELKEVMQALADDERPAIQNFAKKDQLLAKIRSVGSMDNEQRQSLVDEILKMADESGPTPEIFSIASQLAGSLSSSGETDMAVSLYNELAERMEASDDEQLKTMADRARGSARRIGLLGNPMTLEGTTAEGEPFDWQQYRGRVVLVDFWASWCGPCRAEIPNMKRNLEAYGDDFAIVGINMDRTNEAMQEYIDKENLSWVNLVGDEENGTGWDHPIARYYGVSGIPTAILVDQKGTVVSLTARGQRLDESLEKLLGPPAAEEQDAVEKDSVEKDEPNKKDGE